MQSYLSTIRTILTIIYALLYQATPVLSLPSGRHAAVWHIPEARTPQSLHFQSKRAALPSSAYGIIGGGAVGLVLLALVIGLGSASIAILGSTEWREFVDRKKPKPAEGEKGAGRQAEASQERAIRQTMTNSTATTGGTRNTVDEEKGARGESPPRRNRRTLKSFLPPMIFSPTGAFHHSK